MMVVENIVIDISTVIFNNDDVGNYHQRYAKTTNNDGIHEINFIQKKKSCSLVGETIYSKPSTRRRTWSLVYCLYNNISIYVSINLTK